MLIGADLLQAGHPTHKGTNLLKMTPFSAAAASAGDDQQMHEGTATENYGVSMKMKETVIKHEELVLLVGFNATLFSATFNHHTLAFDFVKNWMSGVPS